MNADKAEIGKNYLSKKGMPVTMMGVKGDKVVIRAMIP